MRQQRWDAGRGMSISDFNRLTDDCDATHWEAHIGHLPRSRARVRNAVKRTRTEAAAIRLRQIGGKLWRWSLDVDPVNWEAQCRGLAVVMLQPFKLRIFHTVGHKKPVR
jgi:hypothetical protein